MLPKRTGKILLKKAKSWTSKLVRSYLKFAEIDNQHDNNCEPILVKSTSAVVKLNIELFYCVLCCVVLSVCCVVLYCVQLMYK